MSKDRKEYSNMTGEELAEATKEFDQDGVAETFGSMTPKAEAAWRKAVRKPPRHRLYSKKRRWSMEWRDRIVVNPKVLVGKPVIKGTRISVEFIVDLLGRGWTKEQILREYDHLSPEDIQACLRYASEVLKSERVYPLPT
jgi:uncharacterized protein (DUF433 family)